MSANSAFVSRPQAISGSNMANGAPRTHVYQPGGENRIVHDPPNGMPNYGQEFYTAGRTQGTLMQSKLKFSSMPTLVESKGEKKLMKLLKKQEKEEKKWREKEEKKRSKEEKKRLKLEKKLKIKTLPKSFQYTNGQVLNPYMDSIYKRTMLSLSTIPINYEDGDPGKHTCTPAPNMAPPPPPRPNQSTMSMYASAPDLLKMKQVYGATLPHWTNKELSRLAIFSDHSPRTVVLQRAEKGYGFVLRGAKSQMKPDGELDFKPTAEFPALQYLDSVKQGSVADRARLKAGDFILEINEENVVRASHDRVVHLIRSAKDQLAMKVVSVNKGNQQPEDWFIQQNRSMTMPNMKKKAHAPAPPQRDPRTSLSVNQPDLSANEAVTVMETLDEAIQGQNDGGEQNTASKRSQRATKCVSVVKVDNVGLHGSSEKSKSNPDLVDKISKAKQNIYATPSVSDWKSSSQKNIYALPNVNNLDSGSDVTYITTSPSRITIKPKTVAPPPPGAGSSLPRKQAPKPPSSTADMITTVTSKQSPYAVSKNVSRNGESPESPYQSSFRPGALAKLSEEPIESNGHTETHQHNACSGAVQVRKNVDEGNDSPVTDKINSGTYKQNVPLADEHVLSRAASFLKKHPNAKLLITAEALEQVKNRTVTYEPLPDYDIEEDEPLSLLEEKQENCQSVTVISVSDKMDIVPQTNHYTMHTTIPSEDVHVSYSFPQRPQGTAPSPPNQTSFEEQNSAGQSQQITVKADVSVIPPYRSVTLHTTQLSPSLLEIPPDYHTQQSPQDLKQSDVHKAPKISTATRVAPSPPPPPPPPPPVPTISEIQKLKAEVKADYIPTIPQDVIASAVAKRQERLLNGGPKMAAQKPKEVEISKKNSTQAAILAAVAKRKEKLAQQSTTSVVETIENRLQKTKKLQAAKFQISNSKAAKKDSGNITENSYLSSATLNRTGENISKVPFKVNETPAKEQSSSKPTKELSFKVKPVNITKYQTAMKAIKSLDNKPVTAAKPLKGASSDNIKLKKQESLKLKPEPLEKSVASVLETNKEIEHESSVNKLVSDSKTTVNLENPNVQPDFLEFAEKKRLEFLHRKQKPESKSSMSGTRSPEINRIHLQTVENKQTDQKANSPQALVKSKQNGFETDVSGKMNNYQTSENVPQPPSGFSDGSMNHVVQSEIIPPPSNFSSDLGQHIGPTISVDTASLLSSLSSLSSMSGDQNDGHINAFEDVIAPPPPGFDNSDLTTIASTPDFENNKISVNRSGDAYIDKPINDWACNDVLDWLDSLNMSQYKSNFQHNSIDGRKLLAFTRNNYIELGVTQVGHRMSIERSIKKAAIQQTETSNEIIASERL